MIHKNKLDKSFGPSGSFAGYILFAAGLIATYSDPAGLILVILGAFVGFSSTSTIIDFAKRRIKFSNNLFGFIPTGKWIGIDPEMKFGMKESTVTWSVFSRSNRSTDTVNRDFRIALYDSDNHEIMEINKNDSPESAMNELDTIRKQLGLGSIL